MVPRTVSWPPSRRASRWAVFPVLPSSVMGGSVEASVVGGAVVVLVDAEVVVVAPAAVDDELLAVSVQATVRTPSMPAMAVSALSRSAVMTLSVTSRPETSTPASIPASARAASALEPRSFCSPVMPIATAAPTRTSHATTNNRTRMLPNDMFPSSLEKPFDG